MELVKKDDGWRIPEELWEPVEPLLPPRLKHLTLPLLPATQSILLGDAILACNSVIRLRNTRSS